MRYLPFIIITAILVIYGCKTNPCKEVYCYNGGVCFDGVCRCPAGFSGDFCEIQDSTPTVTYCNPVINCLPGTYEVTESCTFQGNKLYYMTVSASTQFTNYVIFSNLGGDFGPQIQGILNGLDIEIFLQNNGSNIYQGYAVIDTLNSPLKVTITYQMDNDACEATLIKY